MALKISASDNKYNIVTFLVNSVDYTNTHAHTHTHTHTYFIYKERNKTTLIITPPQYNAGHSDVGTICEKIRIENKICKMLYFYLFLVCSNSYMHSSVMFDSVV